MEQLKEKYEKFKAWQIKPHEVKKLSAEKHVCATCHTEFHGNFCPRCGQKTVIGRYSFKTAFLLFLDVWGLGNRGMFRTIRDLLLRPGYMIRDYLNGMQMAYFPPFKMFFLLIALSVLVESGLNVKFENTINKTKEEAVKELNGANANAQIDETDAEEIMNDTINIIGKPITIKKVRRNDSNVISINGESVDTKVLQFLKNTIKWVMDNQTMVSFLWLILLSGPLFLFFRKNHNIPDLRYSECFVAMVYITNMMTIISTAGSFFLPGKSTAIELLSYILSIVPMKQLFGFSYKRTIAKLIGAFVLLTIAVITIIVMIAFLAIYLLNLL
jgi:hypothetical protein